MGFDHADQHIAAGFALALGRAEHGECFADAGIGTKVDAQLSASRTLVVIAQLIQQLVGVGAGVGRNRHAVSGSNAGLGTKPMAAR